MTFEIKVTKEDAGVSPKGFLKKKLDVHYNKIFKMIKEKRLTLNGKKIKQEDKLKTGDIIKCWLDDVKLRSETEVYEKRDSKDFGIDTIFENEDFLVLNKLPGIIVQGAQDNETSLSLHLEYLKQKNKDTSNFQYFHVHRLDKDTSGVLVCAKNQIALRELNEVFRDKKITKKYVCLCDGSLPAKEGEIKVKLDRTPEGTKEKIVVSKTSGKESLSYYKVLGEYEFKDEIVSLVEVEIKTGITHQIRVHMKHLGNPIIGDKMYGNNYVNKIFENSLPRQFLHAKLLEFEFKGENYKFEAPLTKDLDSLMKKLKK